ncbi:hypothetical protein [Tepidibacillus decaturensis]|uniref:Sporulation membrane protein YtrI C-terminal domain-containing protein n=1 Tax=Tepidibacillus decaturensis TaxID=1413211 RepID=A0A135L1N9_9BACI|nr:hypothetical protein [Tepidibacillus decaturensis]KXG42817.1 hypothetical protein U473_01285 [Tepidibacillus decaturensis]
MIRIVTFHIENKLDPFDETALLETLTAEIRFLVGKNVIEVGKNPEFIYQLLNNKSFKTKDKTFLVKVKIIYIQSTTEIWLSAHEQDS